MIPDAYIFLFYLLPLLSLFPSYAPVYPSSDCLLKNTLIYYQCLVVVPYDSFLVPEWLLRLVLLIYDSLVYLCLYYKRSRRELL